MTIQEIMDRLAGNDHEWVGVDGAMIKDLGGVTAEMGTLCGVDPRDGKMVLFRIPLECLRKKEKG